MWTFPIMQGWFGWPSSVNEAMIRSKVAAHRPDILEWLLENCTGWTLNWQDLSDQTYVSCYVQISVIFEDKADAALFKLFWHDTLGVGREEIYSLPSI